MAGVAPDYYGDMEEDMMSRADDEREEVTAQVDDPTLFPESLHKCKMLFKDFVLNYTHDSQFTYLEQLKANVHTPGAPRYCLNLDLAHVQTLPKFTPLAHALKYKPMKYIPVCETALQDLYKELALVGAMNDGDDHNDIRDGLSDPSKLSRDIPVFQLILSFSAKPVPIASLDSEHIERLICVPGIVVQATVREHKAYVVRVKCRKCGHTLDMPLARGSKARAIIPRKCAMDRQGGASDESCGLDPYVIVTEDSKYYDLQQIKLQELPEAGKTGEMPRHISVSCNRYLVDKLLPGTRVTVVGVYAADERPETQRGMTGSKAEKPGAAIKTSYVQALGLMTHFSDLGARVRGQDYRVSPADEEKFKKMARDPTIREQIYRSIAPSIKGSKRDCIEDVRRAVACLLFGGAAKPLADGTRLRGDINVLLLGDPGTAKSQFLKYVERAAPISVYTSGKGSSAAGLTASVLRDHAGRFALEGGAMVLADKGVVCIDEFDKMRPEDKVAIHEAMEQQTISIAKAGITCVLNTRCSVLAAANPMFGSFSGDLNDSAEEMDFSTTILSRFDLIFLIRDVRDEARDMEIARHVIGVHKAAAGGRGIKTTKGDGAPRKMGNEGGEYEALDATPMDTQEEVDDAEAPIKLEELRKYISFCKESVDPRMNEAAANTLENKYIEIREKMREEKARGSKTTIPITVRQLEAIVRISEALARMELAEEATEAHVEEALRLFTMSTLDAANRPGADGTNMSEEEKRRLMEVEQMIRRELEHTNSRKMMKDSLRIRVTKLCDPKVFDAAFSVMLRRGELEEAGLNGSYIRLNAGAGGF